MSILLSQNSLIQVVYTPLDIDMLFKLYKHNYMQRELSLSRRVGGGGDSLPNFYAHGLNDQGHIVFVLSVCLSACLSVVNFNLRYNF